MEKVRIIVLNSTIQLEISEEIIYAYQDHDHMKGEISIVIEAINRSMSLFGEKA